MKALAVLVGISIICSITLFFVLYNKHGEELALYKMVSLLDVKLHTGREVLSEYQLDVTKLQDDLDINNKELEDLSVELKNTESASKDKQTGVDTCRADTKIMTDETAVIQADIKSSSDQFTKERTQWTDEKNGLKKELEGPSKVCKFVNKDSVEGGAF